MMHKPVSLLLSHHVVQVFKEILQADGRDDSLIRTLSGRQVGEPGWLMPLSIRCAACVHDGDGLLLQPLLLPLLS